MSRILNLKLYILNPTSRRLHLEPVGVGKHGLDWGTDLSARTDKYTIGNQIANSQIDLVVLPHTTHALLFGRKSVPFCQVAVAEVCAQHIDRSNRKLVLAAGLLQRRRPALTRRSLCHTRAALRDEAVCWAHEASVE